MIVTTSACTSALNTLALSGHSIEIPELPDGLIALVGLSVLIAIFLRAFWIAYVGGE